MGGTREATVLVSSATSCLTSIRESLMVKLGLKENNTYSRSGISEPRPSNKKLLGARASILVTKGIATSSKDATSSSLGTLGKCLKGQ